MMDIKGVKEAIYNEIDKAIIGSVPKFEPVPFTEEALTDLIKRVQAASESKYMIFASSDELADEFKEMFPFVDIKVLPPVCFEDSDAPQVYIIPRCEDTPIKIVYESNPI